MPNEQKGKKRPELSGCVWAYEGGNHMKFSQPFFGLQK